MPLPDVPSPAATDPLNDSPFLRACRREAVPHTPVWFMRQAGRALPEYRRVREGVSMLSATMNPDLITEITLQPVRRYGVDAAIFFSDIVVPLRAIGIDLDIKPGVGPVVARPIRRREHLGQLRPLAPDDVPYVTAAVQALTTELHGTPLIGFAGAPFTLASYLVEGGPSKNHEQTKAMMYADPSLWSDLLARLADITAAFLEVQVSAGAAAVQLFDSWAGVLPEADYRRHVLPHSAAVFERIGLSAADAGRTVPRIHFGVGTGELLKAMGEAGAEVVGVDFRVPLDVAARRVGPGRAVQGNLDPAVVLAPWPAVEAKVRETLAAGRATEAHVFNLGHGVLPASDPDVLHRIVDLVHELSEGGPTSLLDSADRPQIGPG